MSQDNHSPLVPPGSNAIQMPGSIIEVWRLPVGHTHEDIDGRFGVLSMFIREQSIETPQKF